MQLFFTEKSYFFIPDKPLMITLRPNNIIWKAVTLAILFCFSAQSTLSYAQDLEVDFQTGKPFQLPEALGQITETVQTGSKSRVFLIQDAHGIPSAQVQIESLLRYLKEHGGADTLFLEGAFPGRVSNTLLHVTPDQATNERLAVQLRNKGLVEGAEIFLSQNPSVRAYGIEMPELYRQGLVLFRQVYADWDESGKLLDRLESRILTRSSLLKNSDLHHFLKGWLGFEKDQRTLMAHLKAIDQLAGRYLSLDLHDPINQLANPELVRVMKLRDLETGMNGKSDIVSRESEKEKLYTWLTKNNLQGYRNVFEKMLNSDPQSTARDIRRQLERFYKEAETKGFSFQDYPTLTREFGMRILREELHSEKLFEEIHGLTGQLFRRLAATSRETRLIHCLRDYLILAKLLRLELTAQDEARLRKRMAYVLRLARGFPRDTVHRALQFYRLTRERDEAMFRHTLSALKTTQAKEAVLIAGGFHARGLTERLRASGISYVTIQPRIPELGDRAAYLSAMLLQPASAIPSVSPGKIALSDIRNRISEHDYQFVRSEIRAALHAIRSEIRQTENDGASESELERKIAQVHQAAGRMIEIDAELDELSHEEHRIIFKDREPKLDELKKIFNDRKTKLLQEHEDKLNKMLAEKATAFQLIFYGIYEKHFKLTSYGLSAAATIGLLAAALHAYFNPGDNVLLTYLRKSGYFVIPLSIFSVGLDLLANYWFRDSLQTITEIDENVNREYDRLEEERMAAHDLASGQVTAQFAPQLTPIAQRINHLRLERDELLQAGQKVIFEIAGQVAQIQETKALDQSLEAFVKQAIRHFLIMGTMEKEIAESLGLMTPARQVIFVTRLYELKTRIKSDLVLQGEMHRLFKRLRQEVQEHGAQFVFHIQVRYELDLHAGKQEPNIHINAIPGLSSPTKWLLIDHPKTPAGRLELRSLHTEGDFLLVPNGKGEGQYDRYFLPDLDRIRQFFAAHSSKSKLVLVGGDEDAGKTTFVHHLERGTVRFEFPIVSDWVIYGIDLLIALREGIPAGKKFDRAASAASSHLYNSDGSVRKAIGIILQNKLRVNHSETSGVPIKIIGSLPQLFSLETNPHQLIISEEVDLLPDFLDAVQQIPNPLHHDVQVLLIELDKSKRGHFHIAERTWPAGKLGFAPASRAELRAERTKILRDYQDPEGRGAALGEPHFIEEIGAVARQVLSTALPPRLERQLRERGADRGSMDRPRPLKKARPKRRRDKFRYYVDDTENKWYAIKVANRSKGLKEDYLVFNFTRGAQEGVQLYEAGKLARRFTLPSIARRMRQMGESGKAGLHDHQMWGSVNEVLMLAKHKIRWPEYYYYWAGYDQESREFTLHKAMPDQPDQDDGAKSTIPKYKFLEEGDKTEIPDLIAKDARGRIVLVAGAGVHTINENTAQVVNAVQMVQAMGGHFADTAHVYLDAISLSQGVVTAVKGYAKQQMSALMQEVRRREAGGQKSLLLPETLYLEDNFGGVAHSYQILPGPERRIQPVDSVQVPWVNEPANYRDAAARLRGMKIQEAEIRRRLTGKKGRGTRMKITSFRDELGAEIKRRNPRLVEIGSAAALGLERGIIHYDLLELLVRQLTIGRHFLILSYGPHFDTYLINAIRTFLALDPAYRGNPRIIAKALDHLHFASNYSGYVYGFRNGWHHLYYHNQIQDRGDSAPEEIYANIQEAIKKVGRELGVRVERIQNQPASVIFHAEEDILDWKKRFRFVDRLREELSAYGFEVHATSTKSIIVSVLNRAQAIEHVMEQEIHVNDSDMMQDAASINSKYEINGPSFDQFPNALKIFSGNPDHMPLGDLTPGTKAWLSPAQGGPGLLAVLSALPDSLPPARAELRSVAAPINISFARGLDSEKPGTVREAALAILKSQLKGEELHETSYDYGLITYENLSEATGRPVADVRRLTKRIDWRPAGKTKKDPALIPIFVEKAQLKPILHTLQAMKKAGGISSINELGYQLHSSPKHHYNPAVYFPGVKDIHSFLEAINHNQRELKRLQFRLLGDRPLQRERRIAFALAALNGRANILEVGEVLGLSERGIRSLVAYPMDYDFWNYNFRILNRPPIQPPDRFYGRTKTAQDEVLNTLELLGGFATISQLIKFGGFDQSSLSHVVKAIDFDFVNAVRKHFKLFPLGVFRQGRGNRAVEVNVWNGERVGNGISIHRNSQYREVLNEVRKYLLDTFGGAEEYPIGYRAIRQVAAPWIYSILFPPKQPSLPPHEKEKRFRIVEQLLRDSIDAALQYGLAQKKMTKRIHGEFSKALDDYFRTVVPRAANMNRATLPVIDPYGVGVSDRMQDRNLAKFRTDLDLVIRQYLGTRAANSFQSDLYPIDQPARRQAMAEAKTKYQKLQDEITAITHRPRAELRSYFLESREMHRGDPSAMIIPAHVQSVDLSKFLKTDDIKDAIRELPFERQLYWRSVLNRKISQQAARILRVLADQSKVPAGFTEPEARFVLQEDGVIEKAHREQWALTSGQLMTAIQRLGGFSALPERVSENLKIRLAHLAGSFRQFFLNDEEIGRTVQAVQEVWNMFDANRQERLIQTSSMFQHDGKTSEKETRDLIAKYLDESIKRIYPYVSDPKKFRLFILELKLSRIPGWRGFYNHFVLKKSNLVLTDEKELAFGVERQVILRPLRYSGYLASVASLALAMFHSPMRALMLLAAAGLFLPAHLSRFTTRPGYAAGPSIYPATEEGLIAILHVHGLISLENIQRFRLNQPPFTIFREEEPLLQVSAPLPFDYEIASHVLPDGLNFEELAGSLDHIQENVSVDAEGIHYRFDIFWKDSTQGQIQLDYYQHPARDKLEAGDVVVSWLFPKGPRQKGLGKTLLWLILNRDSRFVAHRIIFDDVKDPGEKAIRALPGLRDRREVEFSGYLDYAAWLEPLTDQQKELVEQFVSSKLRWIPRLAAPQSEKPAAARAELRTQNVRPTTMLVIAAGILVTAGAIMSGYLLSRDHTTRAPPAASQPVATNAAAPSPESQPENSGYRLDDVTIRFIPPVPFDQFRLDGDLESAAHNLRVHFEWLRKADYPYPQVLDSYEKALSNARLMPDGFGNTLLGKRFEVLNPDSLTLLINPNLFNRELKILHDFGSHAQNYYIEILLEKLREAWGVYDLGFFKPELAEFNQVGISVLLNEGNHLLKSGHTYPSKPFSDYLYQFEHQIERLAAINASMEYQEAVYFLESAFWAKDRGLYDPESVDQIFNQKIDQGLADAAFLKFRRKTKQLLTAVSGGPEAVLAVELSHMIPIALAQLMNGSDAPPLFVRSYAFFALLETDRFKKTGEGLDPVLLDRMIAGKNINPESFYASAKRLWPQVQKMTKEVDARMKRRPELRSSSNHDVISEETFQSIMRQVTDVQAREVNLGDYLRLDNIQLGRLLRALRFTINEPGNPKRKSGLELATLENRSRFVRRVIHIPQDKRTESASLIALLRPEFRSTEAKSRQIGEQELDRKGRTNAVAWLVQHDIAEAERTEWKNYSIQLEDLAGNSPASHILRVAGSPNEFWIHVHLYHNPGKFHYHNYKSGFLIKWRMEGDRLILPDDALLAEPDITGISKYSAFVSADALISQSAKDWIFAQSRIALQKHEPLLQAVWNGKLPASNAVQYWLSEAVAPAEAIGLFQMKKLPEETVEGVTYRRVVRRELRSAQPTPSISSRRQFEISEVRKKRREITSKLNKLFEEARVPYYGITKTGVGVFASTFRLGTDVVEKFPIPQNRPVLIVSAGHGQGEFELALAHWYPNARVVGIERNRRLFYDSKALLAAATGNSFVKYGQVEFHEGDFNDAKWSYLFQQADIIYYYNIGTNYPDQLARTIEKNLRVGAKVVEFGSGGEMEEELARRDGLFEVEKLHAANNTLAILTRRAELREATEAIAIQVAQGIFAVEAAHLIGKAALRKILNRWNPDRYPLDDSSGLEVYSMLKDQKQAGSTAAQIVLALQGMPSVQNPYLRVLQSFMIKNKLAKVKLIIPEMKSALERIRLEHQLKRNILSAREKLGIVSRGVDLAVTDNTDSIPKIVESYTGRTLVYDYRLDELEKLGKSDNRLLVYDDHTPTKLQALALLNAIEMSMERRRTAQVKVSSAVDLLEVTDNLMIRDQARELLSHNA